MRSRRRTIGPKENRRKNDNSQFINQIGVCENHRRLRVRVHSNALRQLPRPRVRDHLMQDHVHLVVRAKSLRTAYE